MSSVLPAPAAGGRLLREARRGPFRGLGRRHVMLVVLFALLTPLGFAVFALALGESVHARFVVFEMLTSLAVGTASVLSALVADNTLRVRIGPAWRLGAAIVAAAAVGTVLVEIAMLAAAGPLGLEQWMAMEGKAFASTGQRIANEFAGAARWAVILVVLCELVEANHRAHDELHAARMTALTAEHDLLEGDLRTMQARVDPELLFESLLEIDRGYARDLGSGQERLDALIRFLRAALPGDGHASSTVAREQELAEAYVALAGLRSARGLEFGLSIDPESRQESMPPMLLLPLLRWAMAERSAQRLHLGIRRQAASLAIDVESDAYKDDAPPSSEIASVRERLAQLYAHGASLSIESAPAGRRAALAIPLSPSPATALPRAA